MQITPERRIQLGKGNLSGLQGWETVVQGIQDASGHML